jgi:hypothetical protein
LNLFSPSKTNTMKKLLILTSTFVPLLIFVYNGTAQPNPDWVARYNGPDNKTDNARKIAVDAQSNIYVTGSSQTKSGSTITTVKYNVAGIQQWVARYSASSKGDEYPYGLAVDVNGNVYVTGRSTGSGSALDIVTIKYNLFGVQQWAARYNGPANLNDVPGDIETDASGNVFVTGHVDAANVLGPGAAIITLKYNSSGSLQWISRYDQLPNDGTGANSEEGVSLTLDGNGNVYVTGQSGGLATIKYDPAGQLQWIRNGGNSSGRKILTDGSNNIIVTGFGSKTIKYNTSGDVLWEATCPNASFWDMTLDQSGNVYVTGENDESHSDYMTVKYEANTGSQQWSARFNGSANSVDFARSIALDNSGNVYITGHCTVINGRSTSTKFGTIKYDNSGVQQWLALYDGDGFGVCTDNSGNVYATGPTPAGRTDFDYATIKYPLSNSASKSAATTLVPEMNQSAHLGLLSYPNPFDQNTTIEYKLPVDGKVKLIIYDFLGKEIATLVNESKPAGTYKINFSANKLLAGTYLCRIQAGESTESRKIICVR